MLKISRNLLVAGILALILSFLFYIFGDIVFLIYHNIKFSHSYLLNLYFSSVLVDIIFAIIGIIIFAILSLVSLWGGILGIASSISYIILNLYFLYILEHQINFHFILLFSLLYLISYIIIFAKIFHFNKIAGILGTLGVLFGFMRVFLLYDLIVLSRPVGRSLIVITSILAYINIISHVLYGVGLIIGTIILDSVIFQNTGEALIKFHSQIQGNIKSISLNGVNQALTFFPSYVTLGNNSIEAKFLNINSKENSAIIILDNGYSINVKLKTYSNR
ncbi:hypothetical protein [Saccharolobus caldissimus]|uniref:Uncharacterized protein n=1 Tax=Saccharolobus caldissimus TaxID=1702097 RepID=A0AAQ4CW09_9CREN|nr:hypothetical protein [Saccharolobus caldissimus]BDB99990.1 hypothetical protein SACC_30070 [Saccharolobus caldissimus]